ncbi:serine/threonine-protein kinase BLUS1-like isoform X1 [Rhododendron vialii]|uniref:serine/threonine-protein kinase BLUS1-like isoform X1 n=1 Tax=Rhododendron vialii TaxID=182163 RepID=UPI00265EE6DC|nr:serine/threonine-protein kinase BLUS1-like isoform X1 [Rhododendron vialii]
MGRMGTGGGGRSYSVAPSDYKLLEEVGYGASATVYRAIYLPFNEVVAVKCLDLDRCNSNLDDIRREAQTMSLIDHPNVIRAYCSFVVDRNLWVVMPFMAEGSCLHLMKIAYPDGFEESAIGSILKETLKALEYLHEHGHIHRDVKAGNILLDSNGVVKLADFGVSACMFDKGDRQRSRNTFVGTPCWMAPEVLQPGSGYDFKADIWSFGITALELAHGHAPFSKYPPMKVLLMTIQNAPPGLDYDRDKKFSKSFKEMVAMCLVKDQTKRPTAEKLLKHSFFKTAKPPELSVKKLFADLPPLWNRVKALQLKDAAQLALKKMPSAEQEAISQSEYQRGVSAWNFDIEDLKAQASLVHDDDEMQEIREDDESMKQIVNSKNTSYSRFSLGKAVSTNEVIYSEQTSGVVFPPAECSSNKEKTPERDILESDYQGKVELEKNASRTELPPSHPEKDPVLAKIKTSAGNSRQTQSGPLMPGIVLNHSKSERGRSSERGENENQPLAERPRREVRRAPSFSGPLVLPNRASANSLSAPIKSSGGFRDSLDDKSKANLVQIKGRFSVTSENVDLVKDIPLCTVPRRSAPDSPLKKSASVCGDWIVDSKQMVCPIVQQPKEICNGNVPASFVMLHLQNLFQQTSIQQDLIMNLLNSLQPTDVAEGSQNEKFPSLPRSSENNGIAESTASDRERSLLMKISELQARMINLTEELNAEKSKYTQLQQRLNDASILEEDGYRREGDS